MARAASSQRDTSIRTYQSKRDFTASAEPAPGPRKGKAGAPIFVVQKHQARRAGLHWDFRLEHNDVLWSWAVRKGPSMDPADKRIAVHVEDHPLDYADFQGTIPDGHYGAGTVETWDRGTWEAADRPGRRPARRRDQVRAVRPAAARQVHAGAAEAETRAARAAGQLAADQGPRCGRTARRRCRNFGSRRRAARGRSGGPRR